MTRLKGYRVLLLPAVGVYPARVPHEAAFRAEGAVWKPLRDSSQGGRNDPVQFGDFKSQEDPSRDASFQICSPASSKCPLRLGWGRAFTLSCPTPLTQASTPCSATSLASFNSGGGTSPSKSLPRRPSKLSAPGLFSHSRRRIWPAACHPCSLQGSGAQTGSLCERFLAVGLGSHPIEVCCDLPAALLPSEGSSLGFLPLRFGDIFPLLEESLRILTVGQAR